MSGINPPLIEVDLTANHTRRTTVAEDVRRKWVGGKGLGLYLLSQELRLGLQPSDPACPIYMLCGPLTGTSVPSSSDCALTTLNPDLPHHVSTSHAHAYFGARLAQAGWGGIILRGRAADLTYLWIDGETVQLRSADELRGLDTFETPRRLRALAGGDGDDISVACIGPAGESQVWGASVRVDEYSGWNHGGAGVVWGAKNLKAIAVRGEGSPPIHDRGRFEQVVSTMKRQIEEAPPPKWPYGRQFLADEPPPGFSEADGANGLTWIPMAGEVGTIQGKNFTDSEIGLRFGRRVTEELKKWKVEPEAGWNCDFGCHHRTVCTTGPMAGATFTGFAGETMEEVGPNLGIEDPAIALMISAVVDGYGMKASSAPRIIGMLMEAFNAGEIGLQETDGIDLSWGNHQAVLDLLDLTVQRKGLGELIAEGLRATAIAFGIEHRAVHMKWDGFQDYDQRAAPMFLFQSQVASGSSPTGSMNTELAFGLAVDPELGFPDPLDPNDLSYMAELTYKSGRWCQWENCLGICHFVGKNYRHATLTEAVSAATGEEYSVDEANAIGDRVLTLQRLIQLYLGFSPEEDFVIAARMLEKVPGGPAAGLGMTGDELRRARDEYYHYAGFSTETGVPLAEHVTRLGLDEVTIGRA